MTLIYLLYALYSLSKPPRVTHPIACSNPVKCEVPRGVIAPPVRPDHPRR